MTTKKTWWDIPVRYMLTGLPRTIRRHELRLVVPLADSTIYEMEEHGDFPRRSNLTPRCMVWDLEKVEARLEQRRQSYLEGRAKIAPGPDVHQRKNRPLCQKKIPYFLTYGRAEFLDS